MKSRYYSSEGIVVARKSYGEADRILTIFTENYGKIDVLAKGVRKPESRKRGHLEIFSYIKFSSNLGKGLDLLIEVELIDTYSEIRKSIKRLSVAYFFMEVIDKLTREEEKHEQLFNLLINYLDKLKYSKSLKKLRFDFILDSLITLGFWPKGRKIDDPDRILREITEKELSTIRVAKKMLA